MVPGREQSWNTSHPPHQNPAFGRPLTGVPRKGSGISPPRHNPAGPCASMDHPMEAQLQQLGASGAPLPLGKMGYRPKQPRPHRGPGSDQAIALGDRGHGSAQAIAFGARAAKHRPSPGRNPHGLHSGPGVGHRCVTTAGPQCRPTQGKNQNFLRNLPEVFFPEDFSILFRKSGTNRTRRLCSCPIAHATCGPAGKDRQPSYTPHWRGTPVCVTLQGDAAALRHLRQAAIRPRPSVPHGDLPAHWLSTIVGSQWAGTPFTASP